MENVFLKTFLRLRAHGNVFERYHFRFHAKTVANTDNLRHEVRVNLIY